MKYSIVTALALLCTGGVETLRLVSRYSGGGWVEDLAPLAQGRESHACTSFRSGDNDTHMAKGIPSGMYVKCKMAKINFPKSFRY